MALGCRGAAVSTGDVDCSPCRVVVAGGRWGGVLEAPGLSPARLEGPAEQRSPGQQNKGTRVSPVAPSVHAEVGRSAPRARGPGSFHSDETRSLCGPHASAVGVTVPSYDGNLDLNGRGGSPGIYNIDGQSQRSEARQAQVTLLTRGMDACRAVF